MKNPNIVLAVLDSVSAERMSCYDYERQTTPHIDRIAERSTVYTNAVANSSWTVPTHGTLFTGRHPSEHGAHARNKRFAVPEDVTLSGQLSDAGYRTVGLSTNPWIATEFGYDTGFDEFEDVRIPLPFDSKSPRELMQHLQDGGYSTFEKYVEAAKWAFEGNPVARTMNTIYYRRRKESHANGDVLNDHISSWLTDADEEPFFMFLNYMDAHEPYDPSWETLSKFRDGDCTTDVAWHLRSLNETYDKNQVNCVNDLYDASLHSLDKHIDQLFDILDATGVADETVVLLTADHGKCLGEHGYMGVGTYLYDELIGIPLIVAEPGQRDGEFVSTLTDQVDIHDMVLELAGLSKSGEPTDGVISETLGPHQDVVVRERELPEEGLRRVESDGNSYIRDIASGTVNEDGTLSEKTRGQLADIEDSFLTNRNSIFKDSGPDEMSAEVRNQLEQLGYL